MFAMWCCPHEFGHPLALMCMALTSSSDVSMLSSASPNAWFSPMEDVMPSLQESVPGHVTMSRMVSRPGATKSSSLRARYRSYSDSVLTHRNATFCCWLMRTRPPANLRAMSASGFHSLAKMSPRSTRMYTTLNPS